MAKGAVRAAVASTLIAAAVSPLGAQSPPPSRPSIAQLDHTVWTVREGAPLSVTALAQSADDGVLWIGTTTGLYQFDGSRFEPFDPGTGQALRSLSVSALLAPPDGALWIGYSRGGVSSLVAGRLTSWPPGDGLPAGGVTALARGSEGELWASTTTGLARWQGGRWELLGPESGYPGGFTSDLLVDRGGAVWAAATSGVFVLAPARSRFEKWAPSLDPSGSGGGMPRQAPDGSIWAASLTLGLTRLADASGAAISPAPVAEGLGEAWALLVDRHSNAWVMDGVGLVHVPLSARMSDALVRARPKAPFPWSRVALTSRAQVSSLLEDREGNVWVGTSEGLERFRETKLTPVVFPQPIVKPALAPGVDGAVWVGSYTDPRKSSARKASRRSAMRLATYRAHIEISGAACGSAGRRVYGTRRWRPSRRNHASAASRFPPRSGDATCRRSRLVSTATSGCRLSEGTGVACIGEAATPGRRSLRLPA